MIELRRMASPDVPIIVKAFQNSQWVIKETALFTGYLAEQAAEQCAAWIAYLDEQCAGYVTLNLKSQYRQFQAANIPEIMDLNVLPKFRRKGIGTKLIQVAEQEAAKQADMVGIGAGLYADYGKAQKLYVRLGYRPDGQGITWQYKPVQPGMQYPVDDDLVMWFTKSLEYSSNIIDEKNRKI